GVGRRWLIRNDPIQGQLRNPPGGPALWPGGYSFAALGRLWPDSGAGRWSARVPDHARIAGGALVAPGFVGHAPQVIARPPAEQEFGLGVVEPGRVVGRADADGRQITRSSKVGA